MKNIMSKISLIVVLAMIISLVASCAGTPEETTTTPETSTTTTTEAAATTTKGDSELSGEITHWVWSADYEVPGSSDFNDYYPNIKVEHVTVPSADYILKLQTTVASGAVMPEVVNFEMIPRGMLVTIDAWERLDAEPYNMRTEDLVPWAIPLLSNPDGEIVATQIDNCVMGVVYDRALAIKYFGTDDPDELGALFPTIDAYVEAGKKIASESNGEQYLFAGIRNAYQFMMGLFTSEPLVIDETLNLEFMYEPVFDYLAQFVADGSIGPYVWGTPAFHASLTSGNVLFYPSPSWFIPYVLRPNDPDSEGRWGLMTPPGGGASWGGTAYAIPKKSPDENKMLAWTYIEWFTLSMEGTANFVGVLGVPTLYQPAYETDIYKPNPDPYFGGQDVLRKLIEISEHPGTRVKPMTAYDQSIQASVFTIITEIEQGMSAADALEELKDDLLSQYSELSG